MLACSTQGSLPGPRIQSSEGSCGRRREDAGKEPGAWTDLDGLRVKLWPVAVAGPDAGAGSDRPLAPGELRPLRDRILAGTGTTPVQLGDVQADGKRRMRAPDWVRGLRLDGHPAVLG